MKKKNVFYIVIVAIILICCSVLVMKQKKSQAKEIKNKTIVNSGVSIDNLSDIQTESLYKLCKVWGLAKYYHPKVVKGKLDWDAELFKMMPKVLEAKNQDETNTILYQWLEKYSFKEQFNDKEYEEYITKFTSGNEDFINGIMLDMSWIKDSSYLGNDLSKYLVRLSHTRIKKRSKSYAYVDKTGLINFTNEKKYDINPEDAGMKLLALFRFWNVYEYYSPNITITKKDWDEVLLESIPKMINANNYKDYVLAIAEVASETGDAHINVIDEEYTVIRYYGDYFIPCFFKQIDNQIVVSYVSDSAQKKGLKLGDIITEIEGMTMKERIDTLKRYSVVPEEDKYELKLLLGQAILRTKDNNTNIKVIRNGKEINLNISTVQKMSIPDNKYKNGFMENEKIGYIDPSALKEGELEQLMEKFKSTKGIIVDLRNYPTVFLPYLLGEYIVPKQINFVRFENDKSDLPGAFYYQSQSTGAGTMRKWMDFRKFPFYNGKVMLLMDQTSVSQSEFTIMALRQAPNATVIGSPSIGADGNIREIILPGNISLNISSLGVLGPNGEQTQRVGLKPDVECYQTVKGLQEGRDELIEKASGLILGK